MGDLDQVEFNSQYKGGEIDFWSSGWINIHLIEYILDNEIFNTLLRPDQNEEKENLMNQLKILL